MFEQYARLRRELQTIQAMVALYCRAHHATHGTVCADCQSLLDYTTQRIDHCPHEAEKPSCAKCKIHCFKAEMRERIRVVMRYAGPRMLLYHPFLTVLHYLDSRRTGELKRRRRASSAVAR